jgi:hypothetical protein
MCGLGVTGCDGMLFCVGCCVGRCYGVWSGGFGSDVIGYVAHGIVVMRCCCGIDYFLVYVFWSGYDV